jgi:hypothetical protein
MMYIEWIRIEKLSSQALLSACFFSISPAGAGIFAPGGG